MALDDTRSSISGAFTFKGVDKNNVQEIAIAFNDWCSEMEKKFDVTLINNRHDYNNYAPWDKNSELTKKKE